MVYAYNIIILSIFTSFSLALESVLEILLIIKSISQYVEVVNILNNVIFSYDNIFSQNVKFLRRSSPGLVQMLSVFSRPFQPYF